jgi:3' terminal RNA ribose 2'-O-methyltransferase Hen1
MLLTITYTGPNAADLGYLLHKNPYRPQVFALNYGRAYVFYPHLSAQRASASLLLDIDPIDLVRGKAGARSSGLFDYVNDRPYVSSSFLSTAIARVFGTAMTGRADAHQALADSPLDLRADIIMLPCQGEREKLNSVFEPLGYEVGYESFAGDENFPAWHESKYVNLTIRGKLRLRDLLKHLYVLIPVFDRQKHYWVGADEVEKLLRAGADWLPNHPEKTYIAGRYLKRSRALVNLAFARLAAANAADGEILSSEAEELEDRPDKRPSLNTQRLGSVLAALKNHGAQRVLDLGCGEGRLLGLLLKEKQFTDIAGLDVSHTALEQARKNLKLKRAGEVWQERIQLWQGSLTYKDARLCGYDAVCVIEVIEHLDLSRLGAFERVLFEFTRPPLVVLTTPNKEYNAHFGFLYENDLRHGDHRFEWTREEFRAWATGIAERFSYTVQFTEIGAADEVCGAPTQMGVFKLCV